MRFWKYCSTKNSWWTTPMWDLQSVLYFSYIIESPSRNYYGARALPEKLSNHSLNCTGTSMLQILDANVLTKVEWQILFLASDNLANTKLRRACVLFGKFFTEYGTEKLSVAHDSTKLLLVWVVSLYRWIESIKW